MTSEELYYELHLLVNKNNTSQNINIEKPHFVQLFNREFDKWLYEVLNKKNRDDSVNDIQELLVSELLLKPSEIKNNYIIYLLPDNYFNYSEVKLKCSKQGITKLVYAYNIHPKELNVYLQDEFSKPSFEWEETITTVSGNKLYVYKSDFEVEECYLSYYKSADKIELKGYVKLDGSLSKDINIDLSSIYQRQVLDRVAKEISREFEDVNKFQLAQERLLSE